ncbi:pentapeptide repeat-containing protein [Nocardia terpenica]|uniref:Pentapeptide repeat-containing protein n=1 Tax=Nocardia terpenica TaxID=455432 RepID=A0A6G9Z7X6_9NOCA|nr:pentapeptide repeat-containing protein [Nocardia terpenica]QIS21530.1 pentapeptide repeat-containing protein [Nocardia terpenica]
MRRRGRFVERVHRRMQRSALLLSVVSAVVGGLLIAGLTWWLLYFLFGAETETPNQVDLTKISLSVTAGVGGAVALVVAYRRQRDNERGRFAELFGAAAKQLGDSDVAVRIAGVYAMAGVADEFSARGRRQQCIDVLCGYLRMPFDPAEGASHLATRAETELRAEARVERIYRVRQNDSEVRRTIVAVIVAHVRPGVETSWSTYNFNFDDAVLEDVDFRYVVFAGRHTHFRGAVFTGTRMTNFEQAQFRGKHTTFHGAKFRVAVSFRNARFVPDHIDDASDLGRTGTSFVHSTFSGPTTFEGARFAGPRTRFIDATFAGDQTVFSRAHFGAETTTFEGATFDGGRVRFDGTVFDGARISFASAHFYAGRVGFDDAHLGARARWRRSPTDRTDFTSADYHGTVSFDDAVLAGRLADFSDGDFFGEISFRRTAFAADEVRFDYPKAWVGLHFLWDNDPSLKPANVKPDTWPPTPAELPPVPAD